MRGIKIPNSPIRNNQRLIHCIGNRAGSKYEHAEKAYYIVTWRVESCLGKKCFLKAWERTGPGEKFSEDVAPRFLGKTLVTFRAAASQSEF